MKTTENTLQNAAGKFLAGSIITTIVFMFCLFDLKSQDLIIMKNGSEVKAKIQEISEHEIVYRNFQDQSGVVRSVWKYDIFMIKYENGTKEIFENSAPPLRQPTSVTYSDPALQKFDPDTSDFARIKRKKFNGPRVGFTSIASGTSADYLASNNKRPLLTQFGWQFEGRLFTVEETSGIVEFVPLVGGLEQGMFIPSISALIGIRGGNKYTFEFAIGPNLSVAPDYAGNKEAFFGVVMAAGTSLRKGNVYFPITLAFVPSVGHVKEVHDAATNTVSKVTYHTGSRLSLLFGFNTRKK